MAIIRSDNDYADADLHLLGRHLQLLDLEISRIDVAIKASPDPDSEGLCEAGEYFIGHGFVAIQRYFTTTRSGLRISVSDALRLPPLLSDGLSLAEVINAAANYWKHMEEWIEVLNRPGHDDLPKNAKNTLRRVEAITSWEDYTCANLLASIVRGRPLQLSSLMPAIAEWRQNAFNSC